MRKIVSTIILLFSILTWGQNFTITNINTTETAFGGSVTYYLPKTKLKVEVELIVFPSSPFQFTHACIFCAH